MAIDQFVDVVEVEPEHPVAVQVAPAADLPGAGDPGDHREPPGVALGVELGELLAVAELERPGADQAHLAHQDVPELRELVQAGPPEEPAQRA